VPPWLPRVLMRIRASVAAGRVVLTAKARDELLELGLERPDLEELLGALGAQDRPARLRTDPADQWLYVFRPAVAGLHLYLKLAIRLDCVVISCHEDEPQASKEAGRDR